MANANNKTQLTEASAEEFLNSIGDEQKRADSFEINEIMSRVSGEEPKMWGPGIVGYGLRHIKYESGREMDWMVIGFSPRKANLTLYVGLGAADRAEQYAALLGRLGRYTTGKGCLYIKKLADVDRGVLEDLAAASYEHGNKI